MVKLEDSDLKVLGSIPTRGLDFCFHRILDGFSRTTSVVASSTGLLYVMISTPNNRFDLKYTSKSNGLTLKQKNQG